MGLSLALVLAAIALPPPLPPPGEFEPRVTNPWFPLPPRAALIYRGRKDGEPSRELFGVRGEKTILGVSCTVVRDMLYLRGKLEERTEDWYAQDKAGNVWYFGEATAELYPNGSVKTREGSWQAGVDGARAGIFMPAHPRRGDSGTRCIHAALRLARKSPMRSSARRMFSVELAYDTRT